MLSSFLADKHKAKPIHKEVRKDCKRTYVQSKTNKKHAELIHTAAKTPKSNMSVNNDAPIPSTTLSIYETNTAVYHHKHRKTQAAFEYYTHRNGEKNG